MKSRGRLAIDNESRMGIEEGIIGLLEGHGEKVRLFIDSFVP